MKILGAFIGCITLVISSIAVADSGPNSNHSTAECELHPANTITLQSLPRYQRIWETKYVPKKVTRYRSVLKDYLTLKRVVVVKPIIESGYREETYQVWRPSISNDRSYLASTDTKTATIIHANEQGTVEYRVRKAPVKLSQVTYSVEERYIKGKRYELEAYQDVIYVPQASVSHSVESRNIPTPKINLQKFLPQYVDPFSPAILSGYSSFTKPLMQPNHFQTTTTN